MVILIIVLIAIASGFIYLKATDKMVYFWCLIRVYKKHEMLPHIRRIQEINEIIAKNNAIAYSSDTHGDLVTKAKVGVQRTIAKGKGAIDKVGYRKEFEEHKLAVNNYLDFCRDKKLELSAKEEKYLDRMDETEDLLYPENALDRKLKDSYEKYDSMYSLMNSSGEELLHVRNDSVKIIDDVTSLINSISKHPKEFDSEISDITVEKEKFKRAVEFGKEEHKKLKESAVGAGSGIAAGAAVASLAPTAAMWVATTFGTASTGTAISALSGAAASNAALAWLGGGALAAGGGGMAAGQALLALAGPVGWGVAGASVLTSVLLFWHKKKKIQESKKQEIERMINCINAIREIKANIDSLVSETKELNNKLSKLVKKNSGLKSEDYSTFNDDQKQILGTIVNNTKALAALISKTIS